MVERLGDQYHGKEVVHRASLLQPAEYAQDGLRRAGVAVPLRQPGEAQHAEGDHQQDMLNPLARGKTEDNCVSMLAHD